MKKYQVALLFFIFLTGCSKPQDSSYSLEPAYFGPKRQDVIVAVNAENKKNLQWQFNEWVSTHEFMQSLVSLFEHAANSEIPYLLLDKFYTNPVTTTPIDINDSTYVEAALGIYGPDIFNSINVGNTDNYLYLRNAFANWNTKIGEGLKPDEVTAHFVLLLRQFPSHLKRYEVSEVVASTVESKLEPFINTLEAAQEKFSMLKDDASNGGLTANVEIIKSALETFKTAQLIDEEDLERQHRQLEFPLTVVSKLNDLTAHALFDALLEIILFQRTEYLAKIGKSKVSDMTSEEKQAFLNSFPEDVRLLAGEFREDSEKKIRCYQEGPSCLGFFQKKYYGLVLNKIEGLDIKVTADLIKSEINQKVISTLSATLVQKAEALPKTVGNIIFPSFADSENDFYFNFYDELKKLASSEIKEKLLSGQGTFPGIENKFMPWPLERFDETYKTFFITGGKEIGSSIQANILFFNNIDKAPDHLTTTKFKTYTFALLNRLLAVFGYRDYYGRLYPSLHQPFTETEAVNLDIYTYDLESGVFAIPDNLVLADGYNISTQIDHNLVQTVAGRASLLKASAKLLDFFADYSFNAFDREFSSFQFQGFSVFPKEPMYDLSLGSLSILLRNLTKGEAVFFDQKGELMDDIGDITDDAKGAGSVALLSRSGTQLSKDVQGEDIADYIIALSSVLKSAENLPRARVGVLSRLVDGKQQDLQAIMELLPTLRKLQYGLGIFLHNKMMVDGWLAHTYFLEDKSLSDADHKLIRQLKFIQAMISIHKEWKSDIFLWAAVDAYYALNEKLLTDSGSYQRQNAFPLYEVSEAWKTLVELKGVIDQTPADKKTWWAEASEAQLQRLIEFYKLNWQRLSDVH